MALGENLKKEKLIRSQEDEATTTKETLNGSFDKEQAQLLESLTQNIGLIEFDPNGNILKANEVFLSLVGYVANEIVGRHHRMFMPEVYDTLEYDQFWPSLRRGSTHSGIFEIKKKNGLTGWVSGAYMPVLDENGRIDRIVQYAQDITKQKELELEAQATLEEVRSVEEEMRQNLEELQATQDELGRRAQANEMLKKELEARMKALDYAALITESDLFGTITYVNEKFEEIAGWKASEVIGKPHSVLRHPDNPKSLFKEMWDTIKSGKIFKATYPNRAKDGSTYWVDSTIVPVLDKDGKPMKYISIRFDITERKSLELSTQEQVEKLKASEEEIRQNMEEMQSVQEQIQKREAEMTAQLEAINNAFGMIEFDPEGKILHANDNFLQIVGYELEEVAGKHHRIFMDPEGARSAAYRDFWRDLKNGEAQTSDQFIRISKDGKKVYLNAAYTPVRDMHGKIVKVIKLAINVTDLAVSLKAVGSFLEEIRKGNLDASIDLQGVTPRVDIANMINDNILLRDALREIAGEISRVVNLAGNEGQLSERLKLPNVSGFWKTLLESINQLLDSIYVPMGEITRVITAMSMGDLTQDFKVTGKGDMMDMVNGLRIALRNLSELLRSIERNAVQVADSSQLLQNKADSIKKTTTEVASAIQQMADGAQEQASRTDESSKLVEGILRSAVEMGAKSNIIYQSAETGQSNCIEGLQIMKEVVNNMTDIAESAATSSTSIEVLGNRSEEISRTLNVITDIASQTNLLALNAAIEAARAGDAGRGFAVVAEEIRKLAEDSRRSAVEIDRVIKDVQKDTMSASRAIERMKVSVKSGQGATDRAQTAFQLINETSADTLNRAKEILKATQEQREDINVVVKNIEKIVVVSEETATGTQEIAGSSQDLNVSMNDISAASRSLTNIAAELKSGISKFKL